MLTSANSWAWAEARYRERCVEVVGSDKVCRVTYTALVRWRRRLDEAQEALARGGGLSRQLEEVRRAEKASVKALGATP